MTKSSITKTTALTLTLILIITSLAPAVTTKVTRHSDPSQLLKGETENVIINSQGRIQLARKYSTLELDDALENVWVINTIAEDSAGGVYLGTSPNGLIIKTHPDQQPQIIYPTADDARTDQPTDNDPQTTDAPQTPEDMFSNMHVFALAVDSSDNLIAALSGPEPKLLRFTDGKPETIYQPDQALYILDLALDPAGNIYLATGPEGKIIRLDADGSNPTTIYDAKDNNILSIVVGPDNFIYAGSDERGIVYKVNPDTKTASVLFDSEQAEITSLMFDDSGNLYAAATSAQAAANQEKFSAISAGMAPGKPESATDEQQPDDQTATDEQQPDDQTATDEQLTTPNQQTTSQEQQQAAQQQAQRGSMPKSAGRIYKIDPRGFVTTVFEEMAVFFTLENQDGNLLLGTGNKAELFSIDPATERKEVAYADETSSQLTSLKVSGDSVYIAAANPPQLIKLEKDFFTAGTYTSPLVDADQPARWGKLQAEAALPDATSIAMQARTGNVDDPDDPSFSPWTEKRNVAGPTDLVTPLGRFLQYKLQLTTNDPASTPTVREILIPSVVPNLAPMVNAVTVGQAKNKPHVLEITAAAKDENNDQLTYTYQFRKAGRTNWITFDEDQPKPKIEWNTNTVEDGRYEIRVTASDRKANTPTTALTGTRVSNTFVVDNTAPAIDSHKLTTDNTTATLALTVSDEYSLIGQLRYTVDSDNDFHGTLPNDLVYDTTSESFTITVPDLTPGPHVIAVELKDDLNNTAYRSFEVTIE
ncbi:Two component regulator propeller [Anaerohalosphaera lusitana]|uniref:Two component regulator propeller n=1 Tax=Anaerohalosphaera lusitana TaxID=1936003 RepID=A0A1U9NI37_9BACT|nr:hypothetical protein [Anaerohalosphaera lusitana]AQT67176.1 Two component regulator propeller [Anaerohalosphaera lusitana]